MKVRFKLCICIGRGLKYLMVNCGTQRWVPPSVVLGGIYAFNDRVAHPWFAPAGLNRGGITTAIQAERKLTQGNRDDLYDKY